MPPNPPSFCKPSLASPSLVLRPSPTFVFQTTTAASAPLPSSALASSLALPHSRFIASAPLQLSLRRSVARSIGPSLALALYRSTALAPLQLSLHRSPLLTLSQRSVGDVGPSSVGPVAADRSLSLAFRLSPLAAPPRVKIPSFASVPAKHTAGSKCSRLNPRRETLRCPLRLPDLALGSVAMGGKCEQETALGITENHDFQKKNRKKKAEAIKRALEEAESEVVAVEAKKEKKKKKTERREEEEEMLNDVPAGKKKQKKKHKGEAEQESLENGLVLGSDKESEIKTKKKKKKKENRKEREYGDLNNGLVPDDAKGKEIVRNCGGNGHGVVVDGEEKQSYGAVVVSGKDIKESKYAPLESFDDSGLPKEVLECCKNFQNPSPIQSHSWPFLLRGRDLIGIAATGSGKTLAFGIPAIMHVLQERKGKTLKKRNPVCLVLSPTRELAQQISDVLCDAGKPCGLQSICLYGGTSKGPQIHALESGVDIVIGTPGRLKDLIETGVCYLKEVSFVVLDEADRMLDLGFEPEVRSIISQTCSARQMVMFSATWPLPVHQLAQEFMDPNPVKVVVGSEDLAANHDVMQIVEVLDDKSRDERLIALLGKYHKSLRNRVLVFVLYKKEAARVENMLQRRGWKAVSIHGDKAQSERTKALSLFKEGSSPLMIATDVAARGLDIPDVEVVINYSFPLTVEDYVHRIGRTGRAGKKGVAHTFFTKENKSLAGELVNVLREAGQVVPAALLNFGTHVKKKESKLYGAHFREIDANAPKATKITFNSDDED